jgi:hypothetical protein
MSERDHQVDGYEYVESGGNHVRLPSMRFLAVRDAAWLRTAHAELSVLEDHSEPKIRRISLWRRLAVEAMMKDHHDPS